MKGQKRVTITIISFLLLCICLVGCGVYSTYDKEVTAIVASDNDTFEQPVKEKDLNEYYFKVNKLGFEMYKNNLDKNMIVSPITMANTLLDLSLLLDDDFATCLNVVLPEFNNDFDSKDFSKTQLKDLVSKRMFWLDREFALSCGTDLNYNNLNDFDFYLVDSVHSSNSEAMNKYVKETLGISNDLIDVDDRANCELMGINIIDSCILLNTSSLTHESILVDKDTNNYRKQVIAKDLTCKYISYENIDIVEFPLESINENIVIDIVYSNNFNINDLLKEYEYNQLASLLESVSFANLVTLSEFTLPEINLLYNYNDKDYMINSGLDFLFEERALNTNNGNIEHFTVDQLNQINKLDIRYKQDKEVVVSSDYIACNQINNSFVFVIKDIENHSILYMGYIEY